MQLKVFSLRDQKAEVFNTPFTKSTHGEAERDFTSLVNDPKSLINQYPKDFDLYFLGHYDTSTGKMQPNASPEHLISAIDVLRKEQ